jgi:hypothetical protein
MLKALSYQHLAISKKYQETAYFFFLAFFRR